MLTEVKRILIVDDNDRDVKLTVNALRKNNFANEIDIVNDGEEALDYLYRRGKFTDVVKGNLAIILLDIKMPGMGGIETLKEIRNDPQFKLVPVIILTSSKEENDLVESFRLGANAYVVKPVDMQQFIEAIKLLGQFWVVINEPPPIKLGK